jgi:hypothetical protein
LESWTYNLTEANLNPTESPKWYKQFSFKEAFNLTDLSPKTLKQFAYDMAINHEKLEQVIYNDLKLLRIHYDFSNSFGDSG